MQPTPTPAKRSMKMRVLVALKVLVTLTLLAVLVHQMWQRDGIDALVARLRLLEPVWVVAAVALHFGAVTAGVVRWRTLLQSRGLSLPFTTLYRSFLIGRFIGAFTPSTTGLDGYRLWDVGRRTGEVVKSGAVILIEKLVGLVGMATVCVILLPFGLMERLGFVGVAAALGMAGVAMLGLLLLSSETRTARLAAMLPKALRGRAEKLAASLAGGLSWPSLGAALLMGITSHACLSATFAASGLALQLDVSPLVLLAVGNAIVVSVLLPVSVGGVGVREGVAVALLVSSSVTTTDAVALAVLGYLTGQVPALVGGVLLTLSGDKDRPQPALAGAALAASA
jgi:hypothetical protein